MGELSNPRYERFAQGLALAERKQIIEINSIGAEKWHAEKHLGVVLSQTS
jgi:hypothetical protein